MQMCTERRWCTQREDDMQRKKPMWRWRQRMERFSHKLGLPGALGKQRRQEESSPRASGGSLACRHFDFVLLWENMFLLFKATQLVVIYYSSPRKLKQCHTKNSRWLNMELLYLPCGSEGSDFHVEPHVALEMLKINFHLHLIFLFVTATIVRLNKEVARASLSSSQSSSQSPNWRDTDVNEQGDQEECYWE